MMASPLRLNDSSALACWSRDRSTTSGTMPIIAGIVNADTAPLTPSMTVSCVSVASPLMMRYAASAWVRQVSTCETWSTTMREKRSATTPPTRRKTTIVRVRTPSTCASALADGSMCSTAKASATGTMTEPAVETVRAVKYHANRRSASAPSDCRSFIERRSLRP